MDHSDRAGSHRFQGEAMEQLFS